MVSSADLVQEFEAVWTPEQLDSHRTAGRAVDAVTQQAFAEAATRVSTGETFTEFDLQQWIMQKFTHRKGVVAILHQSVAVGPRSGDPYDMPQGSSPMKRGDLLLLDIWAKTLAPNSVYYDITWTGYLGASPSAVQYHQ